MEPLPLGIDAGTGSVKAVTPHLCGNLCAASQAEYPLHRLCAAWVEQAPGDWWLALSFAVL
ncbi:MAG: hypothetical protein ABR898_19275 [Terracidiphilus sp.]